MDINQSNSIISLDSLDPLRDHFNHRMEKIRFLSLLSPTCPLWRDQGARAVHETITRTFSHIDISAEIVWIPILEKDNIEAVLPSVKFLCDKRFTHLYDQHQKVGKAIANSVGWTGKVAWDIYLFYKPNAKWTDIPPSPSHWMHQLSDNWATKEKYRTGEDLKKELLVSIENLINQ